MPVKNTCKCPNPPGGDVECSKDQMALCIVENGEVRMVCQDVVKGLSDLGLINFALSAITGERRFAAAAISDAEKTLLRSGSYRQGSHLEVTFSLPENIKESLNNLDQQRGFMEG